MGRNSTFILVTLFLLLGFRYTATAQPNLNFKRITVNYPTIELYFYPGCNGGYGSNVSKQDFKVYENGVPVQGFALKCPDHTVRCASSVALVFDASGSMSGTGNAGAKAAARAFVDQMDGIVDQAAVIWYAYRVTTGQEMTSDKPMLYSAIDRLPASGPTSVWDGTYAGVEEVINRGVNQCRAVIVLAHGGDNSSTYTPNNVISLANRNRIHIFTISLGTSTNETELQQIALQTGGRHYQTLDTSQLASIYREISTIIFESFQECVITYQRDCADGGMRTVELQMVNFCGGTDVKTKTYRAPLDPSTYTDLVMELGSSEGKGDSDIKIPLNLVTPMVPEAMFYPLEFTLNYDQGAMQYKSVEAPAGSMLEGIPINVTAVPGGVYVQMMDRKLLYKKGFLMEFTFHASDLVDTTCFEIKAIDAVFKQGCHIPIIDPGEVCIIPREVTLGCTIDIPPIRLDTANMQYVPFPVNVTVVNRSPHETDSVFAEIIIDGDLSLTGADAPDNYVKHVQPVILKPKEQGTVQWHLQHPLSMTNKEYLVRVRAFTEDTTETICERPLYIPEVEFSFRTTLTAQGPVEFCEGDSVILDAGTGYTSYEWSNGADTRQITVKESGQYWVLVQDAQGQKGLSNKLQVMVHPNPSPVITVTGSNPLCPGDSLILDAGDWSAYQWNTGETTRKITVRREGEFYVTVSNTPGCEGTSPARRITLYPVPEKPVIARNGNVLFASPANAWQWFRNGTPIPEARTQIYVLKETGTYAVEITDLNGCKNMSSPLIVTVLDVDLPVTTKSFDLWVFPEPNDGSLTVRIREDGSHVVSLSIYDMMGRIVFQRTPIEFTEVLHQLLDISHLKKGKYVLRVEVDGEYKSSIITKWE